LAFHRSEHHPNIRIHPILAIPLARIASFSTIGTLARRENTS
jgi:hypothetical protein